MVPAETLARSLAQGSETAMHQELDGWVIANLFLILFIGVADHQIIAPLLPAIAAFLGVRWWYTRWPRQVRLWWLGFGRTAWAAASS